MSIVILPYNMGSEGSANLASSLGVRRIRREKSVYKYKNEDVIINWGCNSKPIHIPNDAKVINSFESVASATNKIMAFEIMAMKGVSIPPFTTDRYEAISWSEEDNETVVVRTTIKGHGGEDIIICEPGDIIPEAPLYTMYIPKKSEYRVHVVDGCVIDITRKVLREDCPDKQNVNWKVRNHANGFIFTRFKKGAEQRILNEELYNCPSCVRNQAAKACQALNLDFGAVDIIYNQKQDFAYVLEVNTAPGIADTACKRYAENLERLARKI